jgi:predicted GNAT family acetyltransferase
MHPLDNVIWKALTTLQSHLGVVNNRAGKFVAEVSILGGSADASNDAYQSLASLVGPGELVGLFLEEVPHLPPPWTVTAFGPMLEMVYERATCRENGRQELTFVRLGSGDVPEMLALTELTKPGPFAERTHEMGEYWGIRENGQLIAMAGERLRLPGYTEVSAVCTHPDHLGRGYATALISMLVRRICERGERPFLHVRADNSRAVQLYENLGFSKRVLLNYVRLNRNQ